MFDRILIVIALEVLAVAVAHSGIVSSFGNTVSTLHTEYELHSNEKFNEELIKQAIEQRKSYVK